MQIILTKRDFFIDFFITTLIGKGFLLSVNSSVDDPNSNYFEYSFVSRFNELRFCHPNARVNKERNGFNKIRKNCEKLTYRDFSFFVDGFDLVRVIVFLTSGISFVPLFTGVAFVAFVAFVVFCLLSNNQSIIGY